MSQPNPYQAPVSDDYVSDDYVGDDFVGDDRPERVYPVDACPVCLTQINFLKALLQPSPFRHKCFECRAKYSVRAPYLSSIFAALVVGGCLLGIGIQYLFVLGIVEIALVVAVPFFLCLEWALHRYISKYGEMTRIQE